MISLRQIDAGLALLGLNRSDLAGALGIKISTLNSWFTGQASIPSGRLAQVQAWLQNGGIAFLEDEGVKLNRTDIVKLEGSQGFVSFMTDVMEQAKRGGLEICISNVNEHKWEDNLPAEFAEHYRTEMAKAKGLSSKILVKQGDEFLTASGFAQYRGVPASIFTDDACYYAYGDKLALITFDQDSVQILLLRNAQFANSFRVLFNAIWNNNEVLA